MGHFIANKSVFIFLFIILLHISSMTQYMSSQELTCFVVPSTPTRLQHLEARLGATQCLLRDRLSIPECKQNMTSLRGQARWAKVTSLGGG